MTVSKEAKYLQEFKANTKNSTFLGIIQTRELTNCIYTLEFVLTTLGQMLR